MANATAVKSLRQPTLDTLGLGGVHDIFRKGALPVDTATLVDRVFGSEQAKFMLDRRGGIVQMDADRGKWRK